MNINEVKDLMREFDGSSLREFSWNNGSDALSFSKNTGAQVSASPVAAVSPVAAPLVGASQTDASAAMTSAASSESAVASAAEGEVVKSPLVGVIYRKSAPDKAEFVQVGDSVKKGQTLLIIEAMKVMNEIPAPQDGIITEILVETDEVVEFGQALVRIK